MKAQLIRAELVKKQKSQSFQEFWGCTFTFIGQLLTGKFLNLKFSLLFAVNQTKISSRLIIHFRTSLLKLKTIALCHSTKQPNPCRVLRAFKVQSGGGLLWRCLHLALNSSHRVTFVCDLEQLTQLLWVAVSISVKVKQGSAFVMLFYETVLVMLRRIEHLPDGRWARASLASHMSFI